MKKTSLLIIGFIRDRPHFRLLSSNCTWKNLLFFFLIAFLASVAIPSGFLISRSFFYFLNVSLIASGYNKVTTKAFIVIRPSAHTFFPLPKPQFAITWGHVHDVLVTNCRQPAFCLTKASNGPLIYWFLLKCQPVPHLFLHRCITQGDLRKEKHRGQRNYLT